MYVQCWTHAMELGNPAIDAAHRNLFNEMRRLSEAPDSELEQGVARLAAHLERDFLDEEVLLESADDPGIKAHREEHARILGAMHHVEVGSVAEAREAIRLLSEWFQAHLETMDRALVAGHKH
ncbi:MAG: bacteriohemerythrin [Telluria sp.]